MMVMLTPDADPAGTAIDTRGLAKLRGAAGFSGPLYVKETLVFMFVMGLAGAFLVGIHARVALRWTSFAMNVGLALGGLLLGVVFVESKLQNLYPWSFPAAVQNVSMPPIFGLRGRAGPLHIALLVTVSVLAGVSVMLSGIWWLSRRDVA